MRTILLLLVTYALSYAAAVSTASARQQNSTVSDSIQASTPVDFAAPEANQKKNLTDSTKITKMDTTSQAKPDSLGDAVIADGKLRKIVKRDFDAHEQVVVGSIIMTFIIIIITTTGNWNP